MTTNGKFADTKKNELLEIRSIFFIAESERCTTPDRRQGNCRNIRQCESLLKVLTKRPLTNSDADFLRRSQCGFEGSDPRVCCPEGQTTRPLPSGDDDNNSGNVDGLCLIK